jgi:branched-chain amino acid transport system ATP-binding protein
MTAGDEQALRVAGVSRAFGGLQALTDVSLAVGPGEFFGIVGPNGAGKTTLLNCISGVDPPDSGSVWLGDREVTGLAPHRVAALGVARTFQSADFFAELTVRDYVMVGSAARASASVFKNALGFPSARHSERSEAFLALSLLEEFSLLEVRSTPLNDLPYGIRKLVDILRALNSKPRVLLLDEPTSGTSAEDRLSIAAVLARIKRQGVSILMVDHDIRFISAACDRLLAMNFGKALGVGAPDVVLSQPDVIASYVGLAE